MQGVKKSSLHGVSKHTSADTRRPFNTPSNPFDSDDELDNKKTLKTSGRTSSEPSLFMSNTNPFDDEEEIKSSSSSQSKSSAAKNRNKNDFRDTSSTNPFEDEEIDENQSVQELENYAAYRAEETTETVNNCLKIAEDIREDATKTLVTLHQQGEQISRTHMVAADMDHDLSRGEKLLGSLGGLFSKTWKPKKMRPITGPVITRDDPIQRKGNHLEQRERLGLTSASKERPRTPPPEPTNALQKVEMSGGLGGGSDGSFDADDLSEIRERFMELTKEKEMLRDSKSQGFELIRRLEFHVKTLSGSREEDKKRITDLERELSNCAQEIDYLQDQLSERNSGHNYPGEQACSCHFKLADMENLDEEEVGRLREQIKISEYERSLLMQIIEDREEEIRCSASRIENLEESISSMALEYQCEIESLKLDASTLEQNLFQTKKQLEKTTQENSRLNELYRVLELQNKDAYKAFEILRKENKDLKEKLKMSNLGITAFVKDVEEHFHESLAVTDGQPSSNLKKDTSTYGNVLGPLFSKLAISRATDADLRCKIADMSRQIDVSQLLIRQLKEQLRDERVKAKEEAEDLAQEMAELRYQLTLMLDEERKRRASIEHLSLQRITELEAQIVEERKKSSGPQDLVLWKR